MRKVIYGMTVSLDGFVAGPAGEMEWAYPDEELHRFMNDAESRIDTHLYGRVMYEEMAGHWPGVPSRPDAPDCEREYAAIWEAVDKVVFSRTLETVGQRARLVHDDFVAEIERLKALPGKHMSVGGRRFAGACIRAGLVDECWLFVTPIVLGGGNPMFPPLDAPQSFALSQCKTFQSGVVCLQYERVNAR